MTVIVTMATGDKYHLDRRLSKAVVVGKINEARGKGKLIEFERDLTPTGQMIYFDPDLVMTVKDDR